MNRLQIHNELGRKLRCSLIALVVIAGALVGASAASAVVTQAPVITAKPSDPNTTQANVRFEYTLGQGETSTVAPLTFHCRVYLTATPPPSPEAGWQQCGSTADAPPYGTRYMPRDSTTDLPNGPSTFEVAVSEAGNFTTHGPIASYAWNQNISAPTKAPVVTDQPDDPMRDYPTWFAYEPGEGEADLVDRWQCRVDAAAGGVWESCDDVNVGKVEFSHLKNGEHTFEVRGENLAGWGPASDPITWTGAVPNPEPSVRLGEAAITQIDGGAASDRIGSPRAQIPGVTGLGDVDGDGNDDLAIATGDTKVGNGAGVYVVFGSQAGLGQKNLNALGPNDGYMIKSPGTVTNAVRALRSIGDQNGDGTRDLLIAAGLGSTFRTPIWKVFVVYGGVDPQTLPACPDAAQVRCLDLAAITAEQGYVLTSPATVQLTGFNAAGVGSLADAGDFNGDGVEDIALGSAYGTGSGYAPGRAYVVSGGPRTGTVDVTTLPSDQFFRADGASGSKFGYSTEGIGDVNGDGKDDLYVGAQISGGGHILYGREFSSTLDMAAFSSSDGIWQSGPALTQWSPANLGDLNGDSIPELAFASATDAVLDPDVINVLDGPEQPTPDPLLLGYDLSPGDGYLIGAGGFPAHLGGNLENVGDFDNDGTPDLIASAPSTVVDGVLYGGAAYVVFVKSEQPDEPVELGPELTPGDGVALLGASEAELAGRSVASLGDTDDDGLTDFAVSAPEADPNGMSSAGSVYVVPGSALINQVKTGTAVGVGNDSAVLNAGLSTNDRDTEVHFEYGISEEYGSSTEPETFEGSNSADAASAAIGDLEKGTTYHYRAVAVNALGVTRYGDDRTFTTTNTTDPITDPCAADNTKPGCSGYAHCKTVPADCQGGGGDNANAKLSLISTPKTIKVKRGKKGSVAAIVVNSGGKSAVGVKVCVKAPKKFVKVKKCLTVGGLGSGATNTKTFKVKVTKKAKKGKKISLNFTASGTGIGSKQATAKVAVR